MGSYETHRAMFEAYSRNAGAWTWISVQSIAMTCGAIPPPPFFLISRLTTTHALAFETPFPPPNSFPCSPDSKGLATGVVQWMLNSAFPSNMWNLYAYSLSPGGAFFGTQVSHGL